MTTFFSAISSLFSFVCPSTIGELVISFVVDPIKSS
jgi:hypothetical protein